MEKARKYEGSFDKFKKKKEFKKKGDDHSSYSKREDGTDGRYKKPYRSFEKKSEGGGYKSAFKKRHEKINSPLPSTDNDGRTRLNKYISNAGICSRREADQLIKTGVVSVNGKVVTEMGYKVSEGDVVKYNGASLRREQNVYVLLNKPKDYITTSDDPEKRKTVIDLIKGACPERVYPVGRLDRSTTGVLLLTNDGDLTTRLTHPKFGVKKIYHVSLDKNLKWEDFQKMETGIELEDGPIKPDKLSYVGEGGDKKEIGIEIHSGRNRIVRRIFEHLGYEVLKLDRVAFAGLTKKNVPRGRWRLLTEKEVGFLKMVPSISPIPFEFKKKAVEEKNSIGSTNYLERKRNSKIRKPFASNTKG